MSTSQRIGKYDVIAAISKGPRGAIYRAQDSDTKKQVAIKVLSRSALAPTGLATYRKYSQALTRIDHPAVATFHEIVENEKAIGIVTELCEGKPLSGLLKEGAHPELKGVWDIARQLLEALAFAHVKGAVHRDVKPGNVILGADGRLKVTDFGASLLLAAPSEEVQYRAPEHFREGGAVSARTDIYQAGVIIYQLVTGKLPFTGTPEEIAHRILEERPTDPSSYNNKIAWQLDWVIQKALSKDPVERFGTPIEFSEGLRLGLQDTVGRPLEPIKQQAVAAPAAPTPPAAPVVRTPTAPPPNLAQRAQALSAKPAAPAAEKPAAAPAAVAKPVTPAAPAKPAAAAPTPTFAPDKRPRVIFVDDEERILNALKALFRQEFNIQATTNPEEALAMVAKFSPHLVVSDQRMPAITGVELLRKARTLAPNAVRLLLTGYSDLAALVGSINEGEIFRFVRKPWDNDELRKDLTDALKIALAAENAPPPAPPASPRSCGSLLVIDPKEGLGRGLERLLAGAAHVVQVATVQEAAKAFQGEEIAAIVADMGAGTDGLVALFKQIKAKRPAVQSILLAEEPDSDLGIELINKAQIFRFLVKPVSAKDLRHQVAEALRRYSSIKESAKTSGGPAGGPGAQAGRAVVGSA